jgi:enediyne biosynthesis protein E3
MHLSHFRRILSAITPAEEIFLRPGFRVANAHLRLHLEDIGRAMLHGFRESIANETSHEVSHVPAVPKELEGFACAGAGMALAVFDRFLPQRPTRIEQLVTRTSNHLFMIHLGIGWAIARMQDVRHHLEAYVGGGDDPLRSIALMGYGAHQVYFHWARYVENQTMAWHLSPEGRRAFDAGVGCALWLGEGANVERVATRIAEFPSERQKDLWAGLGFSCAYAGVAQGRSLSYLRDASGPFLAYVAEGAAMAAHVRHVANIPAPYTDIATSRLCRMGSEQAARVADEALDGLSALQGLAGYDAWRNRIRLRFQ